jgi:hypothetical protein
MKHTLLINAVVAFAAGIGSAGAQSARQVAAPDAAARGCANSFAALPMSPQAFVPLSPAQ